MGAESTVQVWTAFVVIGLCVTVLHINSGDPMLLGVKGGGRNAYEWGKLLLSSIVGLAISTAIAYYLVSPDTARAAAVLAFVLVPQVHSGQMKRVAEAHIKKVSKTGEDETSDHGSGGID